MRNDLTPPGVEPYETKEIAMNRRTIDRYTCWLRRQVSPGLDKPVDGEDRFYAIAITLSVLWVATVFVLALLGVL